MIKLYTKQDIAQLMNLSYKTLRIYEEKGLIQPVYINPQNGYKYYSEEDISTIDMIRYSNLELDISLAEIKEILDTQNQQSAILNLLQRKKENAEIMLQKYQQIIANIEHSLIYNSHRKELNVPYIDTIHETFSYISLENIHDIWSLAQNIYKFVGHKHFNFMLKLDTNYSNHITKVGTIAKIPTIVSETYLQQEFVESDFLCIPFKGYDNHPIATKQLEDYASQNNISLDKSQCYLEYHSLDISTLRQNDTIVILKIKIV